MIAQVAQGIMAKFTGSALSTLVGGRIWRDSAKQNETMPYIVFTCISNNPSGTFAKVGELHHVAFYILTDDVDPSTETTGLDALESALRTLYDEAVLTITGWVSAEMLIGQSRPFYSEDDNVIGVIIDYEVHIEKT